MHHPPVPPPGANPPPSTSSCTIPPPSPCPSTLYLHSLFFAVPPRPGPRPPPIPTPCTCSYDFAPLRVYVYDGRDKLQRSVRETLEGQGRKECAWILEDEGGYRLRQGGRRMFLRKVDSGRDTLFLPTSRPHARFTCPRRGVTPPPLGYSEGSDRREDRNLGERARAFGWTLKIDSMQRNASTECPLVLCRVRVRCYVG